ncbi:MAG: DUF4276 family protein [Pseudomonadota bacterium]
MACVVEGHGEVQALPLLLRRMAPWRRAGAFLDVQYPIRVPRNRFLNRPEEFERYLRLAASKCGESGWVLVILDADDDCPGTAGPEILRRAVAILPSHSVSVVLANREFEAWFIGAASSLNGHRGLSIDAADLLIDPEGPRDAKGWLGRRMPDCRYGETTDQPAFAAHMDMQEALDRCRSFRKLCKELDQKLTPL